MNSISIEGRLIGPGHPTYIIAEISANHRQSYEAAVSIVHAAKEAGADAVKLQTYTADTMTIDSSAEPFRVEGTIWNGRMLHELYQEAHTPWDWQPKLRQLATELGMHCFSTPFDFTAVDFLETAQFPAYKVASFELVDLPLLERIARTGKPMIISTGMATRAEIEEAVTAARNAGATQIALLKCTSGYPASVEEMNLRTIPNMIEGFGVPIGLSDHTMDVAVPVAAVTLGACIVEKHITMRRSDGGPDAAFSLEPEEFSDMVKQVRIAERALGRVQYEVSEKEAISRRFRRSLFVVEDIAAGQKFTDRNVRSIRPSDGLHPRHLREVIGRTAAQDLKRGTPLSWDIIG